MKKMEVTPVQLVQMANAYAMEVLKYQGGKTPPIQARIVSKMHLRGVPGLNLVKGI
jgi:hypothetical protein